MVCKAVESFKIGKETCTEYSRKLTRRKSSKIKLWRDKFRKYKSLRKSSKPSPILGITFWKNATKDETAMREGPHGKNVLREIKTGESW
jgi:hypothetical protein